MLYKDKLQIRIEARILATPSLYFDEEQFIGMTMLGENLFYDEAKARVKQAQENIKRDY